MIDPRNVPAVEPYEEVARFVFSKRHIRTSDNTIKADAFIPHPHHELSVTRHREATEREVWQAGEAVAAIREKRLHGRGDVVVGVFVENGLRLVADPVTNDSNLPDNPNHAIVTGWPKGDKGRQRGLALEISARARLIRRAQGVG